MMNPTLRLSRQTRLLDECIPFEDLVERALHHDRVGAAQLRRGHQ